MARNTPQAKKIATAAKVEEIKRLMAARNHEVKANAGLEEENTAPELNGLTSGKSPDTFFDDGVRGGFLVAVILFFVIICVAVIIQRIFNEHTVAHICHCG
jgi:hypothetical protein